MKTLKYILVFVIVFFSLSELVKEKEEEFSYPKPYYDQEEENPDKNAEWTPAQAERHQKILERLSNQSRNFTNNSISQYRQTSSTYANGTLTGNWKNRGPKNMPGAFKYAEMLDGTDIIYGVSHNHYASEYNSKSYIFKGTVYNPTLGSGGDDFEILTANWPNRYKNLFAFVHNGSTRLIAHIENGPLYYSDDEGANWTESTGLPNSNSSATINRQDNHSLYVTNGKIVYKSIDQGENFTLLQDFGTTVNSKLYSPRYTNQPDASAVYLARNGSFYKLNGNSFDLLGNYVTSHNNNNFSIAGDSRKLYVTVNKDYWVSEDQGATWIQKFPHGNYYGNTSNDMDPGKYLAVHPENEDIVLGGYTIPIISTDGLENVITDASGWGRYQNGTNLSTQDYYNRIRFNYHPDFQSNQFFYNSSGTVFSARSSDGGIYISYKEWFDFPNQGVGPNNTDYANAHYININTLNTINPLVYRGNVFTGTNDPDHIFYSTQDQGSCNIIPGTSGDVLDFYQSIGGDGPPLESYDGEHVWRWKRQGNEVYAPVDLYNGTTMRSASQIKAATNANPTVSFPQNSFMGWVQVVIDHEDPDKNLWVLSKNLDRATAENGSITGHTVNLGTNQVAALAQGWTNPDNIFVLQDAKVFISTDRGDTFGSGITTPFNSVNNFNGKGDIGSGIVLPTDDNWILFCGPSTNNVGAILSKDGGNTWLDVTGDFPADSDAQTGGMVATPNGAFVFAGTDIGPFVFDVASETWYSMADGIGFFNAMDVDYIDSTNTVRFGSWGAGIIDFKIDDEVLSNPTVQVNSESFRMYPNPVKDLLSIVTSTGTYDISIFDSNGQQVLKTQKHSIENSEIRLIVSDLSVGVYFVKIHSNGEWIQEEKIIKSE